MSDAVVVFSKLQIRTLPSRPVTLSSHQEIIFFGVSLILRELTSRPKDKQGSLTDSVDEDLGSILKYDDSNGVLKWE